MARSLSILLAALVLLVAPALCQGGVLEHDCDCGSEAACQHEDSCSDDPCETLMVSPERELLANPPLVTLPPGLLPAPRVLDPGPLALARRRAGRTRGRPERWNLPYAASDRPLRI